MRKISSALANSSYTPLAQYDVACL